MEDLAVHPVAMVILERNQTIRTLVTEMFNGEESSVDRLLQRVASPMLDMLDDFKIAYVHLIRELCLKFPRRHRSVLQFFSRVLQVEGGFDYKKEVVDTILVLINEIPDAKESALFHLCEYLENCESSYLSTQILHLLGVEGPKTVEPGRYIQNIYNRATRDNRTRVRACAVESLAKFGVSVESLRPSIAIMLRSCLDDKNDEVRDRATLYLSDVDGDSASREELHALSDPLDVPLDVVETSVGDRQDQCQTSSGMSGALGCYKGIKLD